MTLVDPLELRDAFGANLIPLDAGNGKRRWAIRYRNGIRDEVVEVKFWDPAKALRHCADLVQDGNEIL